MPKKGSMIGLGLLGAAAGAAITYYLFGTESGSRKREKISEMSSKVKEKVAGAANDVSNAAEEVYENVGSFLKRKSNMLQNLDKSEMAALAGRIREHWSDIKEDIEDTLEKAEEGSEE